MHILQFYNRLRIDWFHDYVHILKKFGFVLMVTLLSNSSLSHAQATMQDALSDQSIKQKTPATLNVLVMGDSLSAAYGFDVDLGWVALLQKQYAQFKIHNASISGETTSGGKQRLATLLQQHKPEILVIQLGANDALRGQDLTVSQRNIQQMIDLCPTYNQACRIVLLGVQLPTNYGPAYEMMFQQMYRNLAENNSLLFDPFFLEPVALDPGLMQWDGLHPNAQAQPIIMQRVAPLFDKILSIEEKHGVE